MFDTGGMVKSFVCETSPMRWNRQAIKTALTTLNLNTNVHWTSKAHTI
jgi:hypothetical protein